MSKYQVRLTEIITYTLTVEAENEREAENIGPEIWSASQDPNHDFEYVSNGVTVDAVIAL